MIQKPELELTTDGSHTLYVPQLDEHYHSTNGAIQESRHVFIEAGLRHCTKDEINIFEVGFGTGLNTFLTLIESEKCAKKVIYTTIEAYPLPDELIQCLNYPELLSRERPLFDKIHSSEWDKLVEINNRFSLHKLHANFTQFNFPPSPKYDLVYFDAFAPDKQSEMWVQSSFEAIYKQLNHNGILCTYCAKGAIRRMMQAAGFHTERLPGPPGKREMLRATKI